MTRDNATSRARGITGCLVVVSTSTETAAPGGGIPTAGRVQNPAAVWSLAAALLGFFVVTLDAVIVNVALPAIHRELSGGMSGLQWVVDGYTLMFAALLLSAGSLSDRVGARRAFGAGMVLFVLASAGCGLAPSLPALVAARLVQGSAAAALMPASMALVSQAYLIGAAGPGAGALGDGRCRRFYLRAAARRRADRGVVAADLLRERFHGSGGTGPAGSRPEIATKQRAV